MVTEAVTPLEEYLKENRNELEISWGIHQIAVSYGRFRNKVDSDRW